MTEFEGMAQVVQKGIDEILSLRESNKQLLEALKAVRSSVVCNGDMSVSYAIDGTTEQLMIQAIRKATEQS